MENISGGVVSFFGHAFYMLRASYPTSASIGNRFTPNASRGLPRERSRSTVVTFIVDWIVDLPSAEERSSASYPRDLKFE